MKVVIFAGGLGTRLAEETDIRPKPMVEIGGKPILWHIMKMYSHYGFDDFIICLGYKGFYIKEYFLNYFLHHSDVQINLENNQLKVLSSTTEKFKITLVDTGLNTKTAGRLQRVQKYLNPNEDFMLTYGDGVSDVNIHQLIAFHQQHQKIATVTSIQINSRFGGMVLNSSGLVDSFKEKAIDDKQWINGGFFVLKPQVFDYLQTDMTDVMWEEEPLMRLTQNQQLVAFRHSGFWKCMDALRDKIELEALWNAGAPWKNWS